MRRMVSTNSPSMRRIVAALEVKDMDASQLAKASFTSLKSLTKGGYLRLLRKEGKIHVCSWRRSNISGPWTPIYTAGPGDDAPCPKAKTNAQKAKDWKLRSNYRGCAGRQYANSNQALFSLMGMSSPIFLPAEQVFLDSVSSAS